MESLQRMSAALSHDLNNYTGIIQGYVELMRMELEDEHEFQSYLDRLQQVCTKMLDRSRTLEAFSAKRSLPMLRVDLKELVRTELGEHPRVNLSLPDEPVWIAANPDALRPALRELAENGAEAFPDEAVQVQLTETTLRFSNRSNHPPEADTTFWFEPFYSTRGKGRGLGLARVFGVASAHHAQLRARVDGQSRVLLELNFPAFEERSLE